MITLQYRGPLAVATDKKQEQIRATSVAEVLSYIKTQYGTPTLKQAKSMLITVNATKIQLLNRYKTALADGDTISFLPLAAGG
ncbi:MAG: MoaD/ThiS family protein [Clostridiales bacterium]|nr:MoaD/ThiS family protein [Clostridiales bacterium]